MTPSQRSRPAGDSSVSLEDKYALQEGSAVVSGTQALVLLMILQRRRDQAAGLNTAGFCSGYRGSPLSTLDQEFQRAEKFLTPLGIRFQGGVNEALAATAIQGTQLVHLDSAATVDGVFGMWFGKGAGLDQSVDAMRHANNAGTAPRGGVLAVVGDDHALKSSALAHHCEPTCADLRMPLLYPCDIEETLQFGLLGYALSRDSGCWVGFKAVPEVLNSSAIVDLSAGRLDIRVPPDPGKLRNRHIQWPDPWPAGEVRFEELKLPRIIEFLRLNEINRVVVRAERPQLGLITTGKSYLDVIEALKHLGLTPAAAAQRGLSIYKIGCPWPLEPQGLMGFARGHATLWVIEEKRAFIEDQVKALLYGMAPAERPLVYGQFGHDGNLWLPRSGELSPEIIAVGLAKLLSRDTPDEAQAAAARIVEREQRLARWIPPVARTPFFCSGCPHNTSTKLPEGSRAMAGIGCHGMAMFAPDGRTAWHAHMGGEGATWIAHSAFTSTQHIFQNIGDGTYHHSGSLAIRAAVSAGVNITYKVLFNDAIAMTGGQSIDGKLTPSQVAHQLRDEGIERIAVLSDEVRRISADTWPHGVTLHHRDELDRVQRELRQIKGVTALIYVQTCATEKRRRRKRGVMPEPSRRVFINSAVCEGCGDCSDKSNCLSVVPVDTELGRKRRIDQSACNKDFSCTKGFCPSFMVVEGARIRRRGASTVEQLAPRLAMLPDPVVKWDRKQCYSILCTGIGGTGVVTVGALIVTAAKLVGLAASVHDRIGMAQKFGAVTSHIRLAGSADLIGAARIPLGRTDALIGGDLMVTAQPDVLRTINPGVTRVLLNTDEAAPGAFVMNPDFDFHSAALLANIEAAAAPRHLECIEATRLATVLAGDSIATNVFLLGYAVQRGLVPVPVAALEQAIELNGVAVSATKQMLALGRLAAIDVEVIRRAIEPVLMDHERASPAQDLDGLIARRKAMLAVYQDEAYARRYLQLVERVRAQERQVLPGSEALSRAAATYYCKVLAYKDEYEVARLYSTPELRRQLQGEFAGSYKVKLLLAPPLLARRDPLSGEPRKMTFGPWIFSAFRLLAPFKVLRGTALDPFGRSADRKLERQLILQYEAIVTRTLAALTGANHAVAVRLLSLPEKIRGFGHVKERNYKQAVIEAAKLTELMHAKPQPAEATAEATCV